MADAFSIVLVLVSLFSIGSSLFSLFVSVSQAYENAQNGNQTLQQLSEEVKTLEKIMRDCSKMMQDAANLDSAQNSYDVCVGRYLDLMSFIGKMWEQTRSTSKVSQLMRILKWKWEGKTLMVKYNSFRDAVSLMRDLSAEIHSKVATMFSALLELVSDEGDDAYDERINPGVERANHHALLGNTSDLTARAKKKKERRTELLDLIQSDFNGSIWIIIDVDPVQGQQRSKEVIFRTKWDSGSEQNAITLQSLREEGMRWDLVRPIPQTDRVEFTWLDGQFSYTPNFVVTLHWFTKTDMKKRRDDFFIVPDNAPFDVLIKQNALGDFIKQSMLISFGRHKKKDEKLREFEKQQESIRKAREQVEARMFDTERARNQTGNRGIIRRWTGLSSDLIHMRDVPSYPQ